jgi:carboxylate-amine ligase
VIWADSAPLTLGVEEELMILDAGTLELIPGVRSVLEAAEGAELPGRLKTELFATMLELNTPPCASAGEALASLRELRAAAGALAAGRDLRLAAAGSHPVSVPEEQEIVDEPRYLELVAYAGVSARRQAVQGLHVHVGMPDADSCLRVLEGVLPWLPLLLAVSANSPYLSGRATGLASNRAEVLALLPRHGAPPVFGDPAGWEEVTGRMARLGIVRDYTALWWDARPHPNFGTLEVRIPDQPTDSAFSGAFAALLQALCATLLDDPAAAGRPADRALYEEARWAAAHYGPRASLPHPDGERMADVPSLLAELLELVGPAARRLGAAALLDPFDGTRCEGDRQLEVGEAAGLAAVCADLVERTVR